MTRLGSRRAAFVLATGFVFAALAPASAATAADEGSSAAQTEKAGKPISLTRPVAVKKASKSRARVKLAARSRKTMKVAAQLKQRKIIAAKAEADHPAVAPNVLPDEVANAQAQMPAVQPPAPTQATEPSAPLEVAAADQLNELDRALSEPAAASEPAEPIVKMATVKPAPEMAPVSATSQPVDAPPPTTYAQTSAPPSSNESTLIGKIFIAFGGMLTLASAARMLIA